MPTLPPARSSFLRRLAGASALALLAVSGCSDAVGAIVPPGAPTLTTARWRSSRLVVGWEEPASVGSSPVTRYRVTWGERSRVVEEDARRLAVTLSSGKRVTVSVSARNAAGWGPAVTQVVRRG